MKFIFWALFFCLLSHSLQQPCEALKHLRRSRKLELSRDSIKDKKLMQPYSSWLDDDDEDFNETAEDSENRLTHGRDTLENEMPHDPTTTNHLKAWDGGKIYMDKLLCGQASGYKNLDDLNALLRLANQTAGMTSTNIPATSPIVPPYSLPTASSSASPVTVLTLPITENSQCGCSKCDACCCHCCNTGYENKKENNVSSRDETEKEDEDYDDEPPKHTAATYEADEISANDDANDKNFLDNEIPDDGNVENEET